MSYDIHSPVCGELIRAIDKCSQKWKHWSWYSVPSSSLPFLLKQVARQEEDVEEEVGEEEVGQVGEGEGAEEGEEG